jgi:hypothetical protein
LVVLIIRFTFGGNFINMGKEKMDVKLAYAEIFSVLNKHKDVCAFEIDNLDRIAKYHLFGIELKEVYGLDINPKAIDSLDWLDFGKYRHIGRWGKKYNRTISWPNEGKQPNNELLLSIGFPTGPFIFTCGGGFNQECPEDFFQTFWNELKSFNPDYVDDHNNCLYWKIENAKTIFNTFNNVLQKYYELNKEDRKQRKIKIMKEELYKLEKGDL